MQFATIHGAALHHSHQPRGGGRPLLVFINSLGTDFRIWDEVAADLAADFRLLRYDKRGHGLSDLGEPALHDRRSRGRPRRADRPRRRGDVILCGLSIGGLIAQHLAATAPTGLRALVLCDTAHKIGDARLLEPADRHGRARRASPASPTASSSAGSRRRSAPASAPRFAGCRNMLVRQPVAGYAGSCAAVRDADHTELVGRIAVPTLVVVGDQDGSTPPRSRARHGRPDPGRPLRDHRRRRPHPLRRAARRPRRAACATSSRNRSSCHDGPSGQPPRHSA